jgi:replicative DNA helicase
VGVQLNDIDKAELGSLELEQALLGAILVSGGVALDRINGTITGDDFLERLHGQLFDRFADARKSGGSIDHKLAAASLGSEALALVNPGMTLAGYIARLAAEATTVVNAIDYAVSIREFADKRRMITVAEQIAAGIGRGQTPKETAAFAIDQLDGIAAGSVQPGRGAIWLSDAATRSIDRMTWGMQNPGKLSGISWGLSDLDRMTGGMRRGEFVVMAGRPGMGKSGLATSAARQSAECGSNVLLFSLEMGGVSIADRTLADAVFDPREPIPYYRIAGGSLTDAQAERVVLAQRELSTLPIRIDETAALTVSQIAARARKHKQALERNGKTLDLVIVDHMHLVRASERYSGNRVHEITEISGGLKALAKELDVPMLALAQLSRAVESRDDKRPQMSDLRDSGSIEQDADAIVLLYREAYYLEREAKSDPSQDDVRQARLAEVRNQLEAIIVKQRNGPTGTVSLFFDASCNAARSLARAA